MRVCTHSTDRTSPWWPRRSSLSMANRQWAFDDEFRTLSESRAAAVIKNPVGMVTVKESAEDTGTKVARSNKELLLKVRTTGAGYLGCGDTGCPTYAPLTACARRVRCAAAGN